MKLRALMGEWEGESVVLLGAVDYDVYDAMPEDNWQVRLAAWKHSKDWTGITDTREVDIEVDLPFDLFAAPELEGAVVAPAKDERGS